MNRTLAYRREGGAATLVVVMMLFLVMALLAAYANRSLLFEQRIAGSYSRASLAQEVAEGGVEWALAQLNGPATDAACKPVAANGKRFVDRYLQVDPADRSFKLPKKYSKLMADCTRDVSNEGWACRCPDIPDGSTRTKANAMGGNALTPSFGIQVMAPSAPSPALRNGTLQLRSVGCTSSVVDDCLGGSTNQLQRSQAQYAQVYFTTTIALVSAVRSPPAAPLIVKGDLAMTGAGLGLHNTDARSAGSLLAIGGAWSGMNDARLESVPGTALDQTRVQNDGTLHSTAAADVFKMFMGAAPARYRHHPALREVACNGDCAGALEEAYAAGKRMLWVDGPLMIGSNKTLGSITDPVLIVAKDVVLDGPFQLNGMLVAQGDLAWHNTGGLSSLINGMVLVTGGMQTDGAMDIVYQQTIADQLRNRIGSFVRVPGGWIDEGL